MKRICFFMMMIFGVAYAQVPSSYNAVTGDSGSINDYQHQITPGSSVYVSSPWNQIVDYVKKNKEDESEKNEKNQAEILKNQEKQLQQQIKQNQLMQKAVTELANDKKQSQIGTNNVGATEVAKEVEQYVPRGQVNIETKVKEEKISSWNQTTINAFEKKAQDETAKKYWEFLINN